MSDRGYSASFDEFGEFDSHEALYAYSIGQTDEFWGRCAISRLSWSKPPTKMSECDMKTGAIKWFRHMGLSFSLSRSRLFHPFFGLCTSVRSTRYS